VAPPEDSKEVLARFHSHMDLVDLIARQLARELGRSAELDDLRAMGHQGLLEAARRFDEGRGVTFRRFANYRVRGAMLDGVRKSAPLPRRAHARIRALEAALLVAETNAEDAAPGSAVPSDPHASEQKLTEHLADMATAMAVGLLATPALGDEGEPSAVDTTRSPEEAVAEAELRKIVIDALEELPSDERELVRRHYLEGERFDHVAASLGLSKSWGSRLHTRAVARLTKRLRSFAR
jgi:RNA polymerase sigma factor for flagellar operon FliA